MNNKLRKMVLSLGILSYLSGCDSPPKFVKYENKIISVEGVNFEGTYNLYLDGRHSHSCDLRLNNLEKNLDMHLFSQRCENEPSEVSLCNRYTKNDCIFSKHDLNIENRAVFFRYLFQKSKFEIERDEKWVGILPTRGEGNYKRIDFLFDIVKGDRWKDR